MTEAEKARLRADLRRRKAMSEAKPEADMSLMGRLKDNIIGTDDGVQSYGEKLGSLLNKGGESMTMGLVGDEASAAVESLIPGVDYEQRRDHYRAQERQLEEENPVASLAADVGGAVVAPFGAVGALRAGAGLLPRMLMSAAGTGAMSGVYGFAEGEGGFDERFDDAKGDAGVGAAIGGAIPLVGAGLQKALTARSNSKAIKQAAANAPSTEQLRQSARQAYDEVDRLGVQIKPEAFNRLADEMKQTMIEGGLDQLPGPSSLSPKAARVNQIASEMSSEMATDPTAALPFRSLDQLRRKTGAAAGDMNNRLDSSLGTQAIGSIDDFVKNLTANDVAAGDAKALAPAIEKARSLYAKMARSQTVDDAISAAEEYVSGPASGIRNQFSRILKSDKLSRGFSEAEKAAMRRVVNGSIPERLIHLAGGGLGQLFSAGSGYASGGLLGMIGGAAAGVGARKASEGIASKNAETVRALIANGGLGQLPAVSNRPAGILEQVLRQGTAAGLQ